MRSYGCEWPTDPKLGWGLDIETTMDHNSVHCIVATQGETVLKWVICQDPTQVGHFNDWVSGKLLYAHNGVGFDYPVLERVLGTDFSETTCLDTMLLMQMTDPDHPKGHSLAALAGLVGLVKAASPEDFNQYTEEMLSYCIQDTKIAYSLGVRALSSMIEAKWTYQALPLEHEVAAIIRKQEHNGFRLDIPKVMSFKARLEDEMEAINQQVIEKFYPNIMPIQGTVKKNLDEVYDEAETRKHMDKYGLTELPFSKVGKWRITPINLSSRHQLSERLLKAGWKPSKFTPQSIEKYKLSNDKDDLTPILDESTLSNTPIPEAELLAHRFKIEKILGYVKKWLELVESDGRVRGRVFTIGSPTARMAHFSPNMGQIPSVDSEYGRECRECWIVEEGNVLTGVDASGLELRMLAHYVNNEEFTEQIVAGDIHETNRQAFGIESRKDTKTATYAWLYGARGPRIGKALGKDAAYGEMILQQLYRRWPSIKNLMDKVARIAKSGYLPGLDGRRFIVRMQHAALNTLLQGGGAIVMKKALVILNERLTTAGIPFKFVANVHDEFQIEHSPTHTDIVQKEAVASIVEAGVQLGLRVPLSGEAKTGLNWAETH